jgi:hypothetical protein
MKKIVEKLASESGFIPWDENDSEKFDWSSSYDKELEKLVDLVVFEVLKKCILVESEIIMEDVNWTALGAVEEIQHLIAEKFGIKPEDFDIFHERELKNVTN